MKPKVFSTKEVLYLIYIYRSNDNIKNLYKYFLSSQGSPVCVNITPLQVELLEKDLQDTKVSLQEARIQNQYLSEIIEQQKKLVVVIIMKNVQS